MNCWIWVILLWCFSGNGCGCGCFGNNRSGCCQNDDTPCNSIFPTPEVPSCPQTIPGCGCNNDVIQPRGFAGFGDSSTCGCEENMSGVSKSAKDAD